jgi:hypothetical protein
MKKDENSNDRITLILNEIRLNQNMLIEQQKKILAELAEVRTLQRKMSQGLQAEGTALELLTNRSGLIN